MLSTSRGPPSGLAAGGVKELVCGVAAGGCSTRAESSAAVSLGASVGTQDRRGSAAKQHHNQKRIEKEIDRKLTIDFLEPCKVWLDKVVLKPSIRFME